MRFTFCFSRSCSAYSDAFAAPRRGLTVLAGRVGAPLDRALVGEALDSLQKQLLPLAAAELADRSGITGHVPYTPQTESESGFFPPTVPEVYTGTSRYVWPPRLQTRRFFGGRHPLCGIGVMSRIERMPRPAEASA